MQSLYATCFTYAWISRKVYLDISYGLPIDRHHEVPLFHHRFDYISVFPLMRQQLHHHGVRHYQTTVTDGKMPDEEILMVSTLSMTCLMWYINT